MPQQTHQVADKPRQRQSSQASRAESERQGSGRSEGSYQYPDERDNGAPQERHASKEGHSHSPSISIPVIAMRGIGRIYDIQIAAARLMLQTQASTARAFGWPDYSGLFKIADERARRIFSAGTEQILSLAEQANETTSEVQRQVGRMLESQAIHEAENWQRGLEEIGVQAEESLDEFKELARQQAEESIRATENIGDQSREAIREGGERLRQTVRHGMEQGRELAAQEGSAVREQTEEAGSERETAHTGQSAHFNPERQPQKRKA